MSRREVRIAPGGAHGPRPTGCGGRMGRTGSFAPTRFVRDVVPQGHLFRCAPLQDAVPYAPCHCEPVRAAKQVPLGYRLARQSLFPALAPLDKPVGMGIIINTRGRCIRRSAPAYYGNLVGLMTRKNRHLAEWRFLLFSRWTRIEIECPRI